MDGWMDAGGETHVDVEKESLRWKQTLTFNALLWSGEGCRREGRRQMEGVREGGREGEASMRKGCSEAACVCVCVCREEARINSHCRYRCLGEVMEHDGEFSSLQNTLR